MNNNNNGKKVIIVSCLLLLLSVCGVMYGTYALFSKEAQEDYHITTGNLDFKFERIKLEGNVLDGETGVITPMTPDTTVVDLTTTGENAIDVINFVPGVNSLATFKLTNTGSTAFSTYITIDNLTVKNADNTETDDLTVLENIVATFTVGTNETTMKLSEVSETTQVTLGNSLLNESVTFTLNLYYDINGGNAGQSKKIDFGLKLHSTQLVSQS